MKDMMKTSFTIQGGHSRQMTDMNNKPSKFASRKGAFSVPRNQLSRVSIQPSAETFEKSRNQRMAHKSLSIIQADTNLTDRFRTSGQNTTRVNANEVDLKQPAIVQKFERLRKNLNQQSKTTSGDNTLTSSKTPLQHQDIVRRITENDKLITMTTLEKKYMKNMKNAPSTIMN